VADSLVVMQAGLGMLARHTAKAETARLTREAGRLAL